MLNSIIVTKGEDVSNTVIDKRELSPCTHEGVDTRLFLHAKMSQEKVTRKFSKAAEWPPCGK